MENKYLEYAEIINQAYDVKSNYSLDKKYDLMFIHDDDITSVLYSIQTYNILKKINPDLKLVMVGGSGLLVVAYKVMRLGLGVRRMFDPKIRRYLHLTKNETEAKRLKRIATQLWVPESDIIVSDIGNNTSDNLKQMSNIAKGKKSLVVCLQKNAMIFKQSAEFQCVQHPEMFGMEYFDFDLMVIHQSVEENAEWYNFYVAGNYKVALHMFASLVRRFEVYDGKYLVKPFEPDDIVKNAANELEKRFLIKQRLTGVKKVRALLQYIPLVWDIFWNAERHYHSERLAIIKAKKMLS